MKAVAFLLALLAGISLSAADAPAGREPVFTADGKKVVYQITNETGDSALFLWDLQTDKTVELKIEGTSPFRLSDGRVFYRTGGLFAELYELDLNTLQGKNIPLEPAIGGVPIETGNGKVVYPAGFDDPPELYCWDSRSGKVEAEKDFPKNLQALSPDGKKMVLSTKFKGMDNIALVDRESGKVLYETRQSEVRGCYGAVFSPDNRYLAYLSTGMQPLSDIHLVDLKTLKIIKLTSDGSDNHAPAFSADGRKMVYCHLKDNIYRLKIVDLP